MVRDEGIHRVAFAGSASRGQPSDAGAVESALSGACAGASFNLALFPADSVKSTMQTADELRGPSGLKASFVRTFREMYAASGYSGLIRWVWDHDCEGYTEQCDYICDI